ncbi:M48 family metallopeptidase [Chitinophaga sancti]|uniref:M48 family metallopeptidase n=1 Tax=Chitinophaga sancti TaxID=1004 RepID=A0A1K1QLC8_9BACT|nr:M48 family metallopeptidase [Chitinophaga sancti]WQD65160.1 M48 family metallopeptidase [Chitinophaga sancti]WQG89216.1 M48 family metallopeptidase [Chitinophaga sancti]SFW60419.1 Peptidase family M48 [Chitinophaga sancti]
MQKKFLFLGVSVAMMMSCASVPITGRRQLNLIPESTMQSMALTEYKTFLTENKTVTTAGNKDADMVKRVGARISAAVTQYMTQNNMGNEVASYKWEFNLVDNKEVNAWCMPGGKVVVYTGLLPVTQNETSLACVMGHEIAHAIARHGNERMSQQLVSQGIEIAGSVALNKNPQAQNIFLQSFGVGGNLGLLAFSRQNELEADHLGVIFMAMAGYNPQEAIPFWQRMAAASASSSKPMELMSTHPSDERRIAQLQNLMPEAMKYYKPVK